MFFRSVVAVIAGYAIFAVSAGLLFHLSGQDPHGEATVPFMIGTVVYGVAFALLGGYVSGWIASRAPFTHGLIVAGILAVGASISLLATVGKGSLWTQLTALTAMAPAAALGGYLRGRTSRHAAKAPGDRMDSSCGNNGGS
jgi:hypothetical protein